MDNEFFDWDNIPETDDFPEMNGLFTVRKMEKMYSKRTGKRMYRVNFQCVEPRDYRGMFYSEYYVTGTDENPDGLNNETFGVRDLQKLRIAAQVGKEIRSPEQFCAFMTNTNPTVGLRITYNEKDPQNPNGIGRGGYWKPGTQEVGIITNQAKSGQGRPVTQAKAQPSKVAKPAANRPPKPGTRKAQSNEMPSDNTPPLDAYDDSKKEGMLVECTNPWCNAKVKPEEYAIHLANCKPPKESVAEDTVTGTDGKAAE